MSDQKTLEQAVSDILTAAKSSRGLWDKLKAGEDPSSLPAVDLAAPANALARFLFERGPQPLQPQATPDAAVPCPVCGKVHPPGPPVQLPRKCGRPDCKVCYPPAPVAA